MTAIDMAAPRVLLLVEDNPADADLIEELLEEAGPDSYKVLRATHITEAVQRLGGVRVDVVLLDLSLPDGTGVETVKSIRSVSGQVPIIVLTGTDNEPLALSCINAGAQDYLRKGEIQPVSLRRAIGYAITRMREAQVRELQETLGRYRDLSLPSAETKGTAALAGMGSVRERHPQIFQEIVRDYFDLLFLYLEQLVIRKGKPRERMERVITQLGDAGAGPRDLLDIHVAVLDKAVSGQSPERARSLAVEGRLLALEMMGLLVDYYRAGHRRFL